MPDVCIVKVKHAQYPSAPYGPACVFPELRQLPYAVAAEGPNEVYAAVRTLLLQLGLDAAHAGTEAWNPLGALVKPGAHVLLKPNLVFHEHPLGEEAMSSMLT